MVLPFKQIIFRSIIQSTNSIFEVSSPLRILLFSRRTIKKNYDKPVLLPPEEVEYKPSDPRFLKGPSWRDEPYVKLTQDEMYELSHKQLKPEKEMETAVNLTKIDPNSEPFNKVFEGTADGGNFTKSEVIP